MASDLAALLTAVERLQGAYDQGELNEAAAALEHFDIPSLRASAHQHAEALRADASNCVHCAGDGWLDIMIGMKDHQAVTELRPCGRCTPVRAAAAFLNGAGE